MKDNIIQLNQSNGNDNFEELYNQYIELKELSLHYKKQSDDLKKLIMNELQDEVKPLSNGQAVFIEQRETKRVDTAKVKQLENSEEFFKPVIANYIKTTTL